MELKIIEDERLNFYQLYSGIPEGLYKLLLVSFYKVNEEFYFNFLLTLLFPKECTDKLIPILLIKVSPYPDGHIVYTPSLMGRIKNRESIISQAVLKLTETDMIKLSDNPVFYAFKGAERFSQIFPQNINPHRFPLLWPDVHLCSTIVRYSHIASLINSINSDLTILDFGCGMGVGTLILSKVLSKNAFKIIGVDLDKPQIDIAKSLYSPGNVEFIQQDIRHLKIELKDKFDMVVASEVLEHMEDWEEIVEILEGLLSANGKLAITLPDWKYHGTDLNSDHKVDWGLRSVKLSFGWRKDFRLFSIPKVQKPLEYKVVEDCDFKTAESYLFSFSKGSEITKSVDLRRVLLVNHSIYPCEKSGTP